LVWRIWYEKGVPLDELRYKWTYPDLLKANAILDMNQSITIADNRYTELELKRSS